VRVSEEVPMSRPTSIRSPSSRRPAGSARGGAFARPPAPPRWEDLYPTTRIMAEDGSVLGAAPALPDAELVRLFRVMVLSRELDERMVVLQRQGRIGFHVGAVGEEATIVGATAAMADRDWIFPCYREHASALMRGLPLRSFLANLLGNDGDVARGRQMPCHEVWRAGWFASVSAPLATQIPHAVGAAWAARLKGHDMVALAWFGDGATSASDFHVALNFAGVRKVPVVFACRNNGWAISTPREAQTASETIAQKAVAYGIRGERVDGNDLLAVYDATRRARARAAAGEGPTLLEYVTYRLEAHTTSDDPRAYRPDALVAPWRAKDPMLRLRRHLARRGALSAAAQARLVDEVREEIRVALDEAEALPPKPPLESMFEDVYAAPLRQQREQLEELRRAIAADPRVAAARSAE
jgi:2-oxoisovalerate dehydrogenase E1 component alpha subunit